MEHEEHSKEEALIFKAVPNSVFFLVDKHGLVWVDLCTGYAWLRSLSFCSGSSTLMCNLEMVISTRGSSYGGCFSQCVAAW